MNQGMSPRLWAAFGVGIVAVVGLGLLLVFLSRGPGAPIPITTPASPTPSTAPVPSQSHSPISTPSDDTVVASVNGRFIRYSFWIEAALLDQVMSGLAGQPAPAPDETLQRLINEELVLGAFPSEQALATEKIEMQIARLEAAWEVNDVTVVTALENVGLARATFEQAIKRLLVVQTSLEALQGQGFDTTVWLEEQRASAEIVINQEFENAAIPYVSVAQSPLAKPTPLPTPTPVPATEPPPPSSPTPSLVLPEVVPSTPDGTSASGQAPDFTLRRADGGVFTLTEQLTQGPVVLVFFQKCG